MFLALVTIFFSQIKKPHFELSKGFYHIENIQTSFSGLGKLDTITTETITSYIFSSFTYMCIHIAFFLKLFLEESKLGREIPMMWGKTLLHLLWNWRWDWSCYVQRDDGQIVFIPYSSHFEHFPHNSEIYDNKLISYFHEYAEKFRAIPWILTIIILNYMILVLFSLVKYKLSNANISSQLNF